MSYRNNSSPLQDVANSSAGVSFPNVQLPASTDPPSASNPAKQQTWLVFGASGHMGLSLVKSAMSHGDRVCAVGRQLEDTLSSMRSGYPDNPNYLGLLCDVRIQRSVQHVFEQALQYFMDIDIIAVCSGYGVIGSCEDQDEYEIRNQFETNFMGTLNIIQAALPYFREREAGRYLIFSSTSGALGVPGLGPYCATKYAVEGLVESMLYEVDSFNIKLTLVIAGHMRRDDQPNITSPGWYSQNPTNGAHMASGKKFQHFRILKPSVHYASQDAPASHAQRMLQWIGDNQPTSAVKAAELVWQLGHCTFPPLRLLLGTFAVDSIRDRLKSIIEEIEDWKELHFPPVEGMEVEGAEDESEQQKEGADEEQIDERPSPALSDVTEQASDDDGDDDVTKEQTEEKELT